MRIQHVISARIVTVGIAATALLVIAGSPAFAGADTTKTPTKVTTVTKHAQKALPVAHPMAIAAPQTGAGWQNSVGFNGNEITEDQITASYQTAIDCTFQSYPCASPCGVGSTGWTTFTSQWDQWAWTGSTPGGFTVAENTGKTAAHAAQPR